LPELLQHCVYFSDELLLEAGFLAIFMAPLLPIKRKSKVLTTELISLWLCRFLLFRVLFSTGLGKLLSGCPKWWTLSGILVDTFNRFGSETVFNRSGTLF